MVKPKCKVGISQKKKKERRNQYREWKIHLMLKGYQGRGPVNFPDQVLR